MNEQMTPAQRIQYAIHCRGLCSGTPKYGPSCCVFCRIGEPRIPVAQRSVWAPRVGR